MPKKRTREELHKLRVQDVVTGMVSAVNVFCIAVEHDDGWTHEDYQLAAALIDATAKRITACWEKSAEKRRKVAPLIEVVNG